MKTAESFSIIDRLLFDHKRGDGIDVARVPGFVWLRGEDDEAETQADFLARARRGARAAGFRVVEISGYLPAEE